MNDILVTKEMTTTSKLIAEHFGKAHRGVIRAIDNLGCSAKFKANNFKPCEFRNARGVTYKGYTITRDGFMLLCIGFTGERMMKWKEAFLEAFSLRESAARGDIMDMIKGMDIDIPAVDDLFVYVAKEMSSGRHKIGISKNPEERVRQLNVGNPEPLELVHAYLATEQGHKSERIAHGLYEGEKLRSEWFGKDIELDRLPSYVNN